MNFAMNRHLTTIFIAYCAITTWAAGQNSQKELVPVVCPAPAAIEPVNLYGLWRAEFDGLPHATLLFERHTELSGSVSGSISRDGSKAQLAGDVDNGVLSLEESLDGQRISAHWQGNVSAASCGKEIKGLWTDHSNQASHAFILRKLPGWR